MRILNTHYEDVPPEKSLTPEEIEQICCEGVPVDECSEVGRVSDYNGASQDDIDQDAALEQARADNPGKRILGVRIEDIGRPGKPCGKTRETWQGHLNCCDFVEPMSWDTDTSVEVLAPNTRGLVGVTGGAPPYYWSVRGNGFALNAAGNIRDGFTNTPHVWIYATIHACGRGPIKVTDGCSVSRGEVISTVGRWVDHGVDATCHLTGAMDLYLVAFNQYKYRLESGGVRQYEILHKGNSSNVQNFYENPEHCGDCKTNPATQEYWNSYQPFSDLTPCNTNPPVWWPCQVIDVLGTGAIIRYVCSPMESRSWEEWVC